MKCKKHTVDISSNVGVCASCLHERLSSLAASQNDDNDHSPISSPLVFQRSVSSKKPDVVGGDLLATPQVVGGAIDRSYGGESSSSEKVFESGRSFKKKRRGLSRFSTFFRKKSDDFDSSDASTAPPSSSSSSRSWLSKVLNIRSKKKSTTTTTCYIEDLIAAESNHQPRQRFCRGMSPSGDSDRDRETIEKSPLTPRKASFMGTPGRQKTAMSICLSPLVRAKPNCSSKWKGRVSGELKSPMKPHISAAASFCANRSKKLADLGRADQRR